MPIFAPTPEIIERAARTIRDGGLVAFPTETVYGLGADATNAVAVAKVFAAKQRPSFDPLIVHLATHAMLAEIVTTVPTAARRLAERYWPGPLTLVLPKRDIIPDIVTAGLPSVGVRIPAHPVALDLIARSQRPIAAPSANRFGCVSPTTAQHVADQLGNAVPAILDGGPCRVGVESTILSFVHAQPALLRPGGIPLEEIESLIGPVRLARADEPAIAPGQLARHYATRTPLRIVNEPADVDPVARAGAALLLVVPLGRAADALAGFRHVEVLATDGDQARAAANLFSALRRLDAGDFSTIWAVAVPEHGLCRAIMDRLRRAGSP